MFRNLMLVSIGVLLLNGCATQSQDERLNQDVLVLTQKMEKLTNDLAMLEAEKEKQAKELEQVKQLNKQKKSAEETE